MRRLGMVLLAILFLFMVFAGPAAPKTEAVVVSTVVIGAVIAALAAAGIGLTVSGLTSAELQDWLSGKLNDWATSLGGSVQDHIDSNDITISGRGFLSLGTLAANGIAQFIEWLKLEDSITDNSTKSIIGDLTVLKIEDDLYHAICDDGYHYWSIKRIGSNPLYAVSLDYTTGMGFRGPLVACQSNDQFYLVKDYSYCDPNYTGYSTILRCDSSGSTSSGIGLMWIQPWGEYGYADPFNSITQVYSSRQDGLNAIGQAINSGVYGDTKLAYDTQVITVPTITEGDKWFLDVGADPGVTVETATDAVIADTIDGTLTVSGEVAEEEPEFEVTEPIGISGLTEVFPFCIPFDVYDLLSCLSADPQTPIFTVRFVIPGIINEEFTIDLTPFNAVAQIVRTMELLGFAIGLALVTRERFLRS